MDLLNAHVQWPVAIVLIPLVEPKGAAEIRCLGTLRAPCSSGVRSIAQNERYNLIRRHLTRLERRLPGRDAIKIEADKV